MKSHSPEWVLRAAAATAMFWAGAAQAQDWPQWGGPGRNFRVDATGLADHWSEGGPKVLWERELGDGYSAVTREGERLYTMYAVREKLEENKWTNEGKECIAALDANTGKTVWEYCYDAPWTADMDMGFGPGPHSTPAISGDRVFAIGCTAKLHCLDKQTGKVLWSKDLIVEIGASNMGRGYGASPLVYNGLVILPIGGTGKSVVAFKAEDGSVAWKRHDFSGTFASPILIDVDGQTQLVIFSGTDVLGLDPSTGDLLWNHAHPTNFGANISTPVWCEGNVLFVSSAYGMGARGLKLSQHDGKTEVKELWYSQKMRVHHATAVAVGGFVYGSSGDFGPAFVAAVDLSTGEFAWRERGFSKANLIYADGKLIILDEDGKLALAKPGPKGLEVLGKAQVCKRNSWTVPTLVGHTLYVRDRATIKALDLG